MSLLKLCPREKAQSTPVSVDVRGAEGKAVVDERGVNHEALLGTCEQVLQVAQVTKAAAHTVACCVLVQHKHLTGTEPTLQKKVALSLVKQEMREEHLPASSMGQPVDNRGSMSAACGTGSDGQSG